MLERFLKHFKFLLKSTNQHGVHSPFVYSYLTEGIYANKKSYKGYKKKRRLLQATIDYFGIKEVIGVPEFKVLVNKSNTKKQTNDNYSRLLYIANVALLSSESLLQIVAAADKDTIIYINTPYESAKANENWQQLQSNNSFNVSIDFFIAGILFTREEQIKEHFALRM